LNVKCVIDGSAVSRSYSLCSAPGVDDRTAITVKRVEGGLMSAFICDYAEQISEWRVDGPHGLFHPDEGVVSSEDVVFVAGGSGITPVFSIIKYLLNHTAARLTLVYSNRTPEETIYRHALLSLQEQYSERLNICFVFTKADASIQLLDGDFLRGRITPLILKKLLKKSNIPLDRPVHYYLCGPEGLITMAEKTLSGLGVDGQFVHKEYFTPPTNDDKNVSLPDTTLEVLIQLYEQTNLLEINPGKTILEAALEDRMAVPNSCRSGTCGMCVAKLVSGTVHMRQNFALNETMIKEGYVLLCQSHPLDNRVTVMIE